MGISAPWDDSLGIISLEPVKKIPGINPMGLISPWDDSIYIIYLYPVKLFARY